MPDPRIDENVFAKTYAEAHEAFLETARRSGLTPIRHVNGKRGPKGETLETLVLEHGPADAPNVVVLNSGTHGVEALAGAGILRSLVQDPIALPMHTKLVLIHIINPYGAAWSRYVNEDNVDLLKNYVYGDAATPEDPLFIAFDDAMDLRSLRDAGAQGRLSRARAQFLETHGLERLMASLKKGQSDRPKSICFNGRGAAWSTRTLEQTLRNTAGRASNVLFVDLHTGVGGYGEAHLIVGGDAASQARVRALLGPDAHDSDLVTPKPTYVAQAALLPDAQVTAVTLEAGTVEFGDDFREAMWLEMHDHMYGDPLSAEAQANSARFRSFYYPDDPRWRRLWLYNCRQMLTRLFRGFESWSAARTP